MLTKILIFVGVIVGVFVVARMGASSATGPRTILKRRKARKMKEAEDLRPCAVCGAFVSPGETCTCGEAPTP